MEEGYTRCPEFWDVEYNRKYARLWQTGRPETPVEQALLESRIGRFAICEQKADDSAETAAAAALLGLL